MAPEPIIVLSFPNQFFVQSCRLLYERGSTKFWASHYVMYCTYILRWDFSERTQPQQCVGKSQSLADSYYSPLYSLARVCYGVSTHHHARTAGETQLQRASQTPPIFNRVPEHVLSMSFSPVNTAIMLPARQICKICQCTPPGHEQPAAAMLPQCQMFSSMAVFMAWTGLNRLQSHCSSCTSAPAMNWTGQRKNQLVLLVLFSNKQCLNVLLVTSASAQMHLFNEGTSVPFAKQDLHRPMVNLMVTKVPLLTITIVSTALLLQP